jgi:hypothetical protein
MPRRARPPLLPFFVATALVSSWSAFATPACEPVAYELTLQSVSIDGAAVAGLPSFHGSITFQGGQTYYVESYDPDTMMVRTVGVHP